MSINDFSNKIKGKLGIDSTTIMCLFVLILVAVSSFGLGRLSTYSSNSSDTKPDNESIQVVKSEIGKSGEAEILSEDGVQEKKMYVASKNGKLYYSIGCSGAKRISEKNAIWFASANDAEKAGYSIASSCK
jgi:hypothetical protein